MVIVYDGVLGSGGFDFDILIFDLSAAAMAKRNADKELTDRNWDQEEEGEEVSQTQNQNQNPSGGPAGPLNGTGPVTGPVG